MIGRIVGAALGGAISTQKHNDPFKGALIGAATMFVARRLLPARLATVGAAVAAGFVARKIAQRAERREAALALLTAPQGDDGEIPLPSTASLSADSQAKAARKRARRNDATTFALPTEIQTDDQNAPTMPRPATV